MTYLWQYATVVRGRQPARPPVRREGAPDQGGKDEGK